MEVNETVFIQLALLTLDDRQLSALVTDVIIAIALRTEAHPKEIIAKIGDGMVWDQQTWEERVKPYYEANLDKMLSEISKIANAENN